MSETYLSLVAQLLHLHVDLGISLLQLFDLLRKSIVFSLQHGNFTPLRIILAFAAFDLQLQMVKLNLQAVKLLQKLNILLEDFLVALLKCLVRLGQFSSDVG